MVLLLVGFGINYEKISNLPLLCLSILSRYKFIFLYPRHFCVLILMIASKEITKKEETSQTEIDGTRFLDILSAHKGYLVQ